jgi:hypothetical protein
MRGKYHLLGIMGVALIVSACGESTVTCTLPARKDKGEIVNTDAQFKAGTNCDEIRALWAEGKPVPSIGATGTETATAPEPKPAKPIQVAGPLVPESAGLIEITDRNAKIEELKKNLPAASSKDDPNASTPFSAIVGTIPQLPVLQKPAPAPSQVNADPNANTPPPPPPPPPDTSAATAVKVTGFIELGRAKFVILQSSEDKFPRYVQVGEIIADGKVTVAQVNADPDKVVVVLEQNGVQIPKEININPAAPAPNNPPNT